MVSSLAEQSLAVTCPTREIRSRVFVCSSMSTATSAPEELLLSTVSVPETSLIEHVVGAPA
jgi:hypothetical protein